MWCFLDSYPYLTYNYFIMSGILSDKRRLVNTLLPLIILADMVFYQFCFSSCAYLKGTLLGIDMKLVGLIIPIPLIILALCRANLLYLLGVCFGVGGEIILISFQIKGGIYCPYCLFAATVMVFLFIFNFNRSRTFLMALFVVIGALFFQFFFQGSLIPTYGLLLPQSLLS
jgi:hypothetical protein